MFEDVSLPLAWPVYVSQGEAKAYATWAGKSLPTEAEWQRAAYSTPQGEQRFYPWGSESPSSEFGNFNFNRWDPVPVNAHPAGASAYGISGIVGNGWEWTASEFAPYREFEAFPFYPGYSANFFDGKHFCNEGRIGAHRGNACCDPRSATGFKRITSTSIPDFAASVANSYKEIFTCWCTLFPRMFLTNSPPTFGPD